MLYKARWLGETVVSVQRLALRGKVKGSRGKKVARLSPLVEAYPSPADPTRALDCSYSFTRWQTTKPQRIPTGAPPSKSEG